MAQTYMNFSQAQQQLANIAAIDYFFARDMVFALSSRSASKSANNSNISIEQEHILIHLFMALSESLRAGHTCLPLAEISKVHWAVAFDEQGLCSHQGYVFPSLEILSSLLELLNIDIDAQQPIVIDHNNLYMRRYYQFEYELSQGINERLKQQTSVSLSEISSIVNKLFPLDKITNDQAPREQQTEIDWQKIAVANAINKSFAVIAGGPGTGKTYTVTKLLAALLMLNANRSDKQALEITLVAPTGKAAQRLSESIINAISGFKGLIDDNVLAVMPTQAKTIHRLLGVIPNSPNFRHNQNNLLSCDVLLIDEVSMVDLPMMTRIFRALKSDAKVILLGDADQLPSVAVGSVLADISPRPHRGYSEENLGYLAQVCQLDSSQLKSSFEYTALTTSTYHDYLSFLIKSRRFDGEGGIGKLATHVIQGQATQSWQLLESSTVQKQNQLTLVDNNLSIWLAPLVNKYYQDIAQCHDIAQAFSMLAKFRVLCVTRQGEFGVDALNQALKRRGIKGKASEIKTLWRGNYQLDLVCPDSQDIQVIPIDANLPTHGYTAFINQALHNAKEQSPFIALISDALVPVKTNAVAMLAAWLKMDGVGLASGGIITDSHLIEYVGATYQQDGGVLMPYQGCPTSEAGYMAVTRLLRNISAPHPFCVVFRRELWQQLKGLNEQYSGYYALLDFSLRAQIADWRCVSVPQAQFVSKQESGLLTGTLMRDKQLFAEQWQDWLAQGDPYYNKNLDRKSQSTQFYINVMES